MSVQFGQLTTANYVPRGLRTGDAGLNIINQIQSNSIYNTDSPNPTGGGSPKLTADVAPEYMALLDKGVGQDTSGMNWIQRKIHDCGTFLLRRDLNKMA